MAKATAIVVVLTMPDESPISTVLATADVVSVAIVTQTGAGVLTAPATARMVEIESPALTAAVEIGATAISTSAMVIATAAIVTAVGSKWRGGELGKGDHRDWSGRWRDGKRFDVAHNIRDDWHDRDWKDHHDVPFHGDWWKHHGHHPSSPSPPLADTVGGITGVGTLVPPSAVLLVELVLGTAAAPWFAFDWATPYYWDYGPGEYIHCDNNVIYVNGQWFAPAPVYYEQTVQLAESAPVIAPEQARKSSGCRWACSR